MAAADTLAAVATAVAGTLRGAAFEADMVVTRVMVVITAVMAGAGVTADITEGMVGAGVTAVGVGAA
jgi:hypothetical protein